jgi:hypothetical protein
MALYAVKLGDYVEFRSSDSPPRARKSTLIRLVEGVEWIDKPFDTPYGVEYRRVQKKAKLRQFMRQTFYIGGTVVGVCRLNRYATLAGQTFSLGRKGLVEVPTELKNRCLKETY